MNEYRLTKVFYLMYQDRGFGDWESQEKARLVVKDFILAMNKVILR